MTPQVLRASVVALSVLAASPVLAQATGEDDETTTTTTAVEGETDAVVAERQGFDLGWLGLLGLLGLAGLGGRRRETVTTVSSTPTTHR